MAKRGRPKGSRVRPRTTRAVSANLSAGESKALDALCEAWEVLAAEAVRRAIIIVYTAGDL